MNSLTTTSPLLVKELVVKKLQEFGWTGPFSTWSKQEFNETQGDRSFMAIEKNPKVCGGEPCVAGTRVTVRTLYNLYSQGESAQGLAEAFDLEAWLIDAALDYAKRNKQEIEKLIQQNDKA